MANTALHSIQHGNNSYFSYLLTELYSCVYQTIFFISAVKTVCLSVSVCLCMLIRVAQNHSGHSFREIFIPRKKSSGPVSYTHLTLPTILRV